MTDATDPRAVALDHLLSAAHDWAQLAVGPIRAVAPDAYAKFNKAFCRGLLTLAVEVTFSPDGTATSAAVVAVSRGMRRQIA